MAEHALILTPPKLAIVRPYEFGWLRSMPAEVVKDAERYYHLMKLAGRRFTIGKVLDDLGLLSHQRRFSPPGTGPRVFKPWRGTQIITQGGIYDDSWESTSSTTPAVTIQTPAPVTLTGRIRNTGGGRLILGSTSGMQLTVNDMWAWGVPDLRGLNNRFIALSGWASVVVTNCTIENTFGILLQSFGSNNSVLIARNRHHNICGGKYPGTPQPGNFVQFQDVQTAAIEIAWNEVLNEHNHSTPTDVLSLYKTAHCNIHDNYLQHQSEPDGETPNSWAQGTITLDPGIGADGPMLHNNLIVDNQLVDINAIGMYNYGSTGHDNTFNNNRTIHDGYLPDLVTQFPQWAGPFAIKAGGANNVASGNVIGYRNFPYGGDTYPKGEFVGCPGGQAATELLQTYINPVTHQHELDEWGIWQAKLAANGITIGASS